MRRRDFDLSCLTWANVGNVSRYRGDLTIPRLVLQFMRERERPPNGENVAAEGPERDLARSYPRCVLHHIRIYCRFPEKEGEGYVRRSVERSDILRRSCSDRLVSLSVAVNDTTTLYSA